MEARSGWIWLSNWKRQEEPVLALFRREVRVDGRIEQAVVHISADSRYKLYVNGQLAEAGPSKGDRQVWYQDEVELKPYLTQGKNTLAVQVLYYPTELMNGNHGIFRTETPGLYLEGEIRYVVGDTQRLCADGEWKAKREPHFHIYEEDEVFAPLHIYEHKKGAEELCQWMGKDYDDRDWDNAYEYEHLDISISPGNLLPRTIPYLFREDGKFDKVTTIRKSGLSENDWEQFLKGEKKLIIPAHTEEIVEIEAEREKTAYLHLDLQQGKGSKICILQSECYVLDGLKAGYPLKGRRDDWKNGHLDGYTDEYTAAGYGTEEHPERYEPFWFRTFRYIQLKITTGDIPLILDRFDYTETAYPLQVKTQVETSDERHRAIWKMSERTLRLCMHETYEDCPFYEQLQYAMDARSQILYTYSVAADDRLARKCMDDFRRSQRYDGLLNCAYPSYIPHVIPAFSFYYIFMVYDHMMYFGDKELLEDHLPTIEGILHFFHKHLTPEGYVEKIGGMNFHSRLWSFVDWTKEWNETTGVPPATFQGAITMESLVYIMALQKAAEIVEYLGRKNQAECYRQEAEKVQDAVRTYCMGSNHMIQDGPGIEAYSQHTQVFGILTDTLDFETGRRNLLETIQRKEQYAQCSVAMAFYLFRALQKAGLYEYTEQYWNIWMDMLDKGAMTCVESQSMERSECHGWGALILYELPAVTLGVQPAEPGYTAVKIQPEYGYLTSAKGTVITPRGKVTVEWDKEKNKLEYKVPEGMKVLVK